MCLKASSNCLTTLGNGFWKRMDDLVADVILPYQWQALNDEIPLAEKSHCIKNFRIAAGELDEPYEGMLFQDSDLAKWLEAAAYSLARHPDPELEKQMDDAVALIGRAQCEDGYLNTYFTCTDLSKRWTNLRECHELYCAGHMMEAAVAYYEATGKRALLDIMLKMALHMADVFGPKPGQKPGYPGHPEVELALVRMYRATGESFLLELAKFFVDRRGAQPDYFRLEQERYHSHILHTDPNMLKATYDQTHLPVREQASIEGHSVRALYLLSGMIDVASETADDTLMFAAKKLFNSAVNKRMYVTGGVGSTSHGEAFTLDYDLPNHSVYAETCASIALIFAAQRLFLAEPLGLYGDVMERALYNTCLGGMSLDGKRFFYVNPLETDPAKCAGNPDLAHVLPQRPKWFGCACCPPNLARLIASLGQYLCAADSEAVYVNLYVAGTTTLDVGGQSVTVEQQTGYPYSGEICLTLSSGDYGLCLRLPEWADRYELSLNGEPVRASFAQGFLRLDRTWKDGDAVSLSLEMKPRRVYANPDVSADIGKVAIQRGPIIYCAEEADNGPGLHRLRVPQNAALVEESRHDLAPDAVGIVLEGGRTSGEWAGLYQMDQRPLALPHRIRLIPYYLWANRSVGEMRVWLTEC